MPLQTPLDPRFRGDDGMLCPSSESMSGTTWLYLPPEKSVVVIPAPEPESRGGEVKLSDAECRL